MVSKPSGAGGKGGHPRSVVFGCGTLGAPRSFQLSCHAGACVISISLLTSMQNGTVPYCAGVEINRIRTAKALLHLGTRRCGQGRPARADTVLISLFHDIPPGLQTSDEACSRPWSRQHFLFLGHRRCIAIRDNRHLPNPGFPARDLATPAHPAKEKIATESRRRAGSWPRIAGTAGWLAAHADQSQRLDHKC